MPVREKIRRLKKMSTVLKNTSANGNMGTSAKMRLSRMRKRGMSTSAEWGMSTSGGRTMSGGGMSTSAKGRIGTSAKGLGCECRKRRNRVAVKLRGLCTYLTMNTRSNFQRKKLSPIPTVNFIVKNPVSQASVRKS